MSQVQTFDPVWEGTIYGQGRHFNRWPFDMVVSFVFRHAPRDRPRDDVRILEVGCGAGNNLLFAAREGFTVAGIDASPTALEYARRRFAAEGLQGDLRVGDFTNELPFEDASFDLVVDRGAITCCGRAAGARAVAEVRRVLVNGGKFLFNPWSAHHGGRASGRPGRDGVTEAITAGTAAGVGQLCFYGKNQVRALFYRGWRLLSMEHVVIRQELESGDPLHADWRVVACKLRQSLRPGELS